MRFLLLMVLALSTHSFAKSQSKVKKDIRYLNHIFAHLHKSPSRYSSSMTSLSCGHPVVVTAPSSIDENWLKVEAGLHKGYMHKSFLQKKRPQCFQLKYPKFFNALNLDVTEVYYWARLFDQFQKGESTFK